MPMNSLELGGGAGWWSFWGQWALVLAGVAPGFWCCCIELGLVCWWRPATMVDWSLIGAELAGDCVRNWWRPCFWWPLRMDSMEKGLALGLAMVRDGTAVCVLLVGLGFDATLPEGTWLLALLGSQCQFGCSRVDWSH